MTLNTLLYPIVDRFLPIR